MTYSRVVVAAVLACSLVGAHVGFAASDRTPEDTVKGYLSAMQSGRFNDAYDFVSTTLRAGKDREEWAREQQYIVQVGEV